MPSEVGPIILYGQKFEGTVPQVGDVSEETRLRDAPIGVYELWFRQQPRYQCCGAFLLNEVKADPQLSEQQQQFEVSESIADAERTLMIQRTGEGINLNSVEIIPLDWREQPLEFTVLEVTETQRSISYRKDAPVESLKLKFSGVNVFDVEIINAALWTHTGNYSPGELPAFIRRAEDIRIDRLGDLGGVPRTIEEHLLTFFHLLLEEAPNRTFDFECGYRYRAVDGGANTFVPVLFTKSLTLPTASESFSNLLPLLSNWYKSFSPPEGVFDFGVKIYGVASESVPVLDLTGMILPIESIANWS